MKQQQNIDSVKEYKLVFGSTAVSLWLVRILGKFSLLGVES